MTTPTPSGGSSSASQEGFLGLDRYQWRVFFAAWLGWGFDAFDALLFNYVAPLCVPDLLNLAPGDPLTRSKVVFWNGMLASLLLIGWTVGGVLFGKITDRVGRTRTLLLTMLTYAVATAACAFAPNLYVLAFFRAIAALGIGGEWAAGAALVAESVPERRRVFAGALLYTAAPAGIFAAGWITDFMTHRVTAFAGDPGLAWRAVFLTGLVPAFAALWIRRTVREPEAWTAIAGQRRPRVVDLFAPELRRKTLGGLAMASTALITWWSCNAFLAVIFRYVAAGDKALQATLPRAANDVFAFAGLIGTLLTIPIASRLGRRPMFTIYFLASAMAIWLAFGPQLAPWGRVAAMGVVGLTTFGVLGSFTFYLPELFPTALRGTGSGFCYNVGRLLTAAFPFAIGAIALDPSINPLAIVRWVALVPLLGSLAAMTGLVEETRRS